MIFIIIGFSMVIIPALCYMIWALFIDPIKTFIKAKRKLKEIPTSSKATQREIIFNYEMAVKDIKGMIVILVLLVAVSFICIGALTIKGG